MIRSDIANRSCLPRDFRRENQPSENLAKPNAASRSKHSSGAKLARGPRCALAEDREFRCGL